MPDKKNETDRRNAQITEAKETIEYLKGLARQHGIPEKEITRTVTKKKDTK